MFVALRSILLSRNERSGLLLILSQGFTKNLVKGSVRHREQRCSEDGGGVSQSG